MQEYKVIITNNLNDCIDYLLQINQKYPFIKYLYVNMTQCIE